MAPAWEKAYATGYHFPGTGWVKDPTRDGFANTPWPPSVQKQLDDIVADRRDVLSGVSHPEAWLDSLTYYDLLDKLGYGAEVRNYIDPGIDRKSTRLNSSHYCATRMPPSACKKKQTPYSTRTTN